MSRIDNIRGYLNKNNVDAILLNSSNNKFYIASLYSSSGYVFITNKSQYIIVDFRYFEEMKKKAKNFEVILMNKEKTYFDIVNKICEIENINSIGFEGSEISFDSYNIMDKNINADLLSVDLSKLRYKKDEKELEYIKRACEIADNTFNHITKFIKVKMTEKEVENEIVRFIKEQGGQRESFDVIVASGIRGALPHGKASNKVIEKGEFVTLDFGVRFNNYCSDITRTISMGEGNDELNKIYNIVKKANEEAIRLLKPGMTTGDIDKIARDIIDKEGYKEYFGHNLGHGVGIMVHEYPSLAPNSSEVIKEGMVITIEPGIYIPNLGGVRIEDDILVIKDGCKVLTKSRKDLIKIENK